MNHAEHILSELQLAEKQQLLDLSIRPERTCTVFYIMFSNSVNPQNRLILEETLRSKYGCRVATFKPDGLMIQCNSVLSALQIQTL